MSTNKRIIYACSYCKVSWRDGDGPWQTQAATEHDGAERLKSWLEHMEMKGHLVTHQACPACYYEELGKLGGG